jgi:alkanesulfonate monooxygenase SsuD/methylene tetrahydromethanopterin reductase-like flavin-dependent oxidoreductase (luciferase family)
MSARLGVGPWEDTVEFIANFMTCDLLPAAWAQTRQAEGWDVLGCADHFFTADRPYPHLWVTLATMAAATTTVRLTSSFANNLLRTPVEFAQAALALQAASGGRFEAGLGAGWTRNEIEGASLPYPSPSERAGRYAEAIQIVRALLLDGRCTFRGRYYDVNIPVIGPCPGAGAGTGDAPPLVASLGGDRTIREIAPLVDRVELKLISAATRSGQLELDKLASIPRSHLDALVAKVRAVNETVPLSVFILCSVGDDARTRAVSSMLGDSFIGGFFGDASTVADSMHALAEAGISRVQVSPFSERSFELLAPKLSFGRR